SDVVVLVSAIEPFVRRVPCMFQAAIIVITVSPRHRAVGGIAAADVGVLVIHVVERVSGGPEPSIVADLLAGGVAIRHALACTPGAISDVGSKAGEILRVLIGPDVLR